MYHPPPPWLSPLKFLGVLLAIAAGFAIYAKVGNASGPLSGSLGELASLGSTLTPTPASAIIDQISADVATSVASSPLLPTLAPTLADSSAADQILSTGLSATSTPASPTQPASPAIASVGATAPAFSLPTLDGTFTFTLGGSSARVFLLNFWASWCIPCRTESPELEKVYEQYRDSGLSVVGINSGLQDDPTAARDFVKKYGLTYPILLDKDDAVIHAYGVIGLPTSVFVNAQGQIMTIQAGGMDAATLKDILDRLLAP